MNSTVIFDFLVAIECDSMLLLPLKFFFSSIFAHVERNLIYSLFDVE